MSTTLVCIFGGADFKSISEWEVEPFYKQWGAGQHETQSAPTLQPDEIVATLLTGVPPSEHRVVGSKHYTDDRVRWFESRLPAAFSQYRLALYWKLGWDTNQRRYIAEEIQSETLFDEFDSEPLFVPSYTPETQWCFFRNTLRPDEYDGLGEDACLELIEKNFWWRKHRLEETLRSTKSEFVMIHFQYLDSFQHVFGNKSEKTQQAYKEIGELAEEITDKARNAGFENILFLSEHGNEHPKHNTGIAHYNRPFHSTPKDDGLSFDTTIDIHKWIQEKIP